MVYGFFLVVLFFLSHVTIIFSYLLLSILPGSFDVRSNACVSALYVLGPFALIFPFRFLLVLLLERMVGKEY